MSSKILLVDDDDLIRRSLAFTLEQGGYQTITAASAEDALALVKRDPPDLVLLDIGLPGMDGLQAMRHFQDQGIPVIFLTARRRELDEILEGFVRSQLPALSEQDMDDYQRLLETEDPQKAQLVKLKFFVGLTTAGAADVLGIPLRTAERSWAFARAWLYRQIAENAVET